METFLFKLFLRIEIYPIALCTMKFFLLIFSMTLGVTGQLLLKKGVLSSSLAANPIAIIKTVFSPLVFSGLSLYAISAIAWLFVLQKFPLSVAYPTLAVTYIAIVIASFLFLQEPISTSKTFGILLIFTGVFFLYR